MQEIASMLLIFLPRQGLCGCLKDSSADEVGMLCVLERLSRFVYPMVRSCADDETSSGDVTRLGSSATEPAMLRPLHRQAGGRDEEPAPYFAWQPVASASR